jgi:hypothetical protein
LGDAQQGDGSLLLALADQLVERRPDGSYANLAAANTAVNCLDHAEPRSIARYFRDEASFARVAPHFGPLTAFGAMSCAFWPIRPLVRPRALHAAGAPPILVIGTTRDPATPYRWAVALAHELESGILLAHNGDGHTVYGDGSSPCVDAIGNAYLIERRAPAPNTVC